VGLRAGVLIEVRGDIGTRLRCTLCKVVSFNESQSARTRCRTSYGTCSSQDTVIVDKINGTDRRRISTLTKAITLRAAIKRVIEDIERAAI
jgi:hypothetical protein